MSTYKEYATSEDTNVTRFSIIRALMT